MFIIKMMGGEQYKISAESYKKFEGKQGLVYIPEIQCTINFSSISSIYPESMSDEVENRKQQQTGVLHDGTRVARHFGEWVVANEIVPDDDGKYQHIKLDPVYYPEVAADCVATEKEFMKITTKENYYLTVGYKKPEERTSTQGLTSIL